MSCFGESALRAVLTSPISFGKIAEECRVVGRADVSLMVLAGEITIFIVINN